LNATKGRTVIKISHRLSTTERADRVAVMEHGRLVEVASRDGLVEQGDPLRAPVCVVAGRARRALNRRLWSDRHGFGTTRVRP
jgi:ABC-type multidrug transport system ATPase subunit